MKRLLIPIYVSVIAIVFIRIAGIKNPLIYLSNRFYVQAFQASASNIEIWDKIAIVNIRDFPAEAIKDQVEILSLYKPKVIGLDYFPNENFKHDLEKIEFTNLVQPISINAEQTEIEFSTKLIADSCHYGFINVHSTSHFNTFLDVNESVFPSLPTKIIELYDSGMYKKILARNFDKEIINYYGNTPQFLYLDDISSFNPDLLEQIENKIVLVGYTGLKKPIPDGVNDEDSHITPRGKMYGVILLANILYTLMDHFITPMNIWSTILSSTLLIIITTVGSQIIFNKYSFSYPIIKVFQVFGFATVFVIGSLVINYFQISIDYEIMCFAIIISAELTYWNLRLI